MIKSPNKYILILRYGLFCFFPVLQGCPESDPLQRDGPMPINDGSLTRYSKSTGGLAPQAVLMWKKDGEFIDIAERLSPVAGAVDEVYSEILGEFEKLEPIEKRKFSHRLGLSVNAVIFSLDPDLAAICVTDTLGYEPSLPFSSWRTKVNTDRLRDKLPNLIQSIRMDSLHQVEFYVGEVLQRSDRVFIVGLEGGMKGFDLNRVGDSLNVFLDDQTSIDLLLESPDTIRCIRRSVEAPGSGLD